MLKMIKGLKKALVDKYNDIQADLVEARFVWTEPHSRRIVIELDIKKEIENGFTVIVEIMKICHMQGKTRVTFKENLSLCPDCCRTSTNFTWEALVQIRQHVIF